ncbi:hypothetical protein PR048_001414 [Dryococelus australis]|uniref:Reverse transcriptase Ty1/copia-type domain-containing protein n=1 Tax=Dryococelus australis TaxID=614101 RepID=A0ABQ9IHB1_9NEOP|nr:hypothetical protein PR048_001414 [Dryococelus australis]
MQDEGWCKAVQKELNALDNLNVRIPFELLISEKAIETRWVFKTKQDGVKRARLVGKGYQENSCNDNYSPVARMSTVRIMLSKAVQENLNLRHLYIPTAFLYGDLQNTVYIKLSEGTNIKRGVLKMKLRLCTACRRLLVVGMIGYTISSECNIVKALEEELKVKDLGKQRVFLGLNIERKEDAICISQFVFVQKILKKFGMKDCKNVCTPMETGFQAENDG